MQPRTLAIVITLLPLFAVNAAYLMSAYNGLIPWCLPYLEGCTSISQAGRSGDTIFLFRAIMIVYAVLMAWFWLIVKDWLDLLDPNFFISTRIICWLGVIGATFLILYVDFLGTSGEFHKFLRRYGIIIYFSFTPLAQLLLLRQLYKLKSAKPDLPIDKRVLQYKKIILLLILLLGIISVVLKYTGNKTYQSENIIEWNYSALLIMYFAGTIVLWKNLRLKLTDGSLTIKHK